MIRDKKMEHREKEELLKVLSKIDNNKQLLDDFLEDLLTPAEYRDVAKRWQIVKELNKGVPQHKISEDLQIAIGTVTRGSRSLLNPQGGFNKVLSRE